MADFSHIQSIQTSSPSDAKAMLKLKVKHKSIANVTRFLKVAGSPEALTVTCSSTNAADSMADLVDGYCRLAHNTDASLWKKRGEN